MSAALAVKLISRKGIPFLGTVIILLFLFHFVFLLPTCYLKMEVADGSLSICLVLTPELAAASAESHCPLA